MTDKTTYNLNYRKNVAFENAKCFEGGFGVYVRCSKVCCLF